MLWGMGEGLALVLSRWSALDRWGLGLTGKKGAAFEASGCSLCPNLPPQT